jgi:hypothetical protein
VRTDHIHSRWAMKAALAAILMSLCATHSRAQTSQVPLGKLSRLNNNLVLRPVAPSAIDRPHPVAGGLTKPMSPGLAQPGWYVPRGSYSTGAASPSSMSPPKPGWYLAEGAATQIMSSKLGWFTPKATANGDSSLAFNRPGWYLPENNLADSSGMLAKSASTTAAGGPSAKKQAGRLGGSNLSGLAAGLSNVGGTPPTQFAASQQSQMTKQALKTSRRLAAGRFPYNSSARIGGSMPSGSKTSGGSRTAGNSAELQSMMSSWRTSTVYGQTERSISGSRQPGRRP